MNFDSSQLFVCFGLFSFDGNNSVDPACADIDPPLEESQCAKGTSTGTTINIGGSVTTC